ncbi:MAG: GNAT family N-acetyltransferase [Thermoplasmata archaeon]|nr:MAG: GNAT family N-acetyltransferase [Thermoplasmata archaeon]KAA0009727.1 MAG: GNAT family N-acetyltransferase [Thermoplasmata archaeon]
MCADYPEKYIERIKLKDGLEVLLRPIKPEDEDMMLELFNTFSERTIRFRFFIPLREMSREDVKRYCNIDYRNEMAIVAEIKENGRKRRLVGVARLIRDREDRDKAEFAVVVGDPWQNRGLGRKLTEYIIWVAKDMGIKELYSRVMKDNIVSLRLSREFGFEREDAGIEYLIRKKIQ